MATLLVRQKKMARKKDVEAREEDDGEKEATQARLELPPEDFKRLRVAAKRRGLKVASFVRMAVLKEIERVEEGRD